MIEWNSVADGMPPDGDAVLVFNDGRFGISILTGGKFPGYPSAEHWASLDQINRPGKGKSYIEELLPGVDPLVSGEILRRIKHENPVERSLLPVDRFSDAVSESLRLCVDSFIRGFQEGLAVNHGVVRKP